MSRINYDLTRLRAIAFDVDGVLSPTVVPMDENGTPQRMANLKDGYAMKQAVKHGLRIAIITGADTEAVRKRFEKIGVKDIYIKAGRKSEILSEWMSRHGLESAEVAFVGDDVPDAEAMKIVGLPVAPADACSDIKEIARFITKAEGGYGVAREIIEDVLKAQGKWPAQAAAFGD